MLQSKNAMALVAVMVLAVLFALSGCSSSTKTKEVEVEVEVPGPTVEVPVVGTPAFVDLPDGVMPMAGNAEIVAGGSATIGEVTFSCAPGGHSCSVSVDENGVAVSNGGTVTAATSPAYTARLEEEEEAKRIAALTKAAGTKAAAMATEAEQAATNNGGLGGSQADGTPVTTYSLDISRDGDGTTIKIEDSAFADDEDPKFAQAMDLGHGTTMHVREMEADDDGNVMDEVVMVTTDIEAPKPVPFEEWQAEDGMTPQVLNARADNVGVDTANPADSLTVVAGTDNVNLPLIMSPSFAAPPAGSSMAVRTFLHRLADADDTTPGDQPRAAAMVSGTYNEADGTYVCAGTSECTVTVDADGDVTAISGTWVFTPDKGAESMQVDRDYLHYGFWLSRTKDANGDVTSYNEVETIAGSSIPASASIPGTLTGTASYSGGATGVYVRNVFKGDGTVDRATSGHFTADANLTATFNQVNNAAGIGTIAADKLNTLAGTIDKFVLAHGEENDWSVELLGTITTAAAVDEGTTDGGGVAGAFTATFHGSTADDTNPSSVVGEFNAGFSNGAVAGAFGAREDK